MKHTNVFVLLYITSWVGFRFKGVAEEVAIKNKDEFHE